MPRVRRSPGFILVVALSVMALMVVISMTLMYQGKMAATMMAQLQRHNQVEVLIDNSLAQVGSSLQGHPTKDTRVKLPPKGESFTLYGPDPTIRLDVDWQGDSIYQEPLSRYSKATNLFEDGSLPGNLYDESEMLVGSNKTPVLPGATLAAFQSKNNESYLSLYKASFPYVAYAPNGKLQVNTAMAWVNPTFDEDVSDLAEQPLAKDGDGNLLVTSGLTRVPCHMLARDSISIGLRTGPSGEPMSVIDKVPYYGYAYSENGPIYKRWAEGISFVGPLPKDQFAPAIRSQVNAAFSDLKSDQLDRTPSLVGVLYDMTEPWKFFQFLMKPGKAVEMTFSLQQAMMMPMPPLPASTNMILIDVVAIHAPYPSDWGTKGPPEDMTKEIAELQEKGQTIQEQIKEDQESLVRAQAKLKTLNDQLTDAKTEEGKAKRAQEQAKKELDNATDANKASRQQAYDNAKKAHDTADQAVKDAQKAVDDQNDTIDGLNDKIADGNKALKENLEKINDKLKEESESTGGFSIEPSPVPITSSDEVKYGNVGWAYVELVETFTYKLFKDVFSGHFKKLAEDLGMPVRVVHLANSRPDIYWPDEKPMMSDGKEWTKVNELRAKADDVEDGYLSMAVTWTVPQGRTCAIKKKDVQIRGDLWLQRGSSMYVERNLLVSSPAQWFDAQDPNLPVVPENYPVPSGRIIMDEGSTLIVGGDLTVHSKGKSYVQGGRVVLTSPIGEVHAINRGIICKGSVTIERGITSGVNLEEMTSHFNNLDDFTGFLKVFFTDLAPNLAKAYGPFSTRKCWFAKWATTFWLVPLLDDAPVPIPTPIANCERTAFEWISRIYCWELNFNLGENLYLMSPWWPLGNGVVPVIPKLPPKSYEDSFDDLGGIVMGDIGQNLESSLTSFVEKGLPELAEEVAFDILGELISTFITRLTGFAFPKCRSKVPTDGSTSGMEVLTALTGEMAEEIIKKLGKRVFTAFRQGLMDAATQVDLEVTADKNPTHKEIPGIFIYAGGDINFGRYGGNVASGGKIDLIPGFFVAEGDVNALLTGTVVGAVASLNGNVELNNVLYYPPFTRVSLYNPARPGDYDTPFKGVPWLAEAFQFTPPHSKRSPVDIDIRSYHVGAQGWSR
jgi:uncharacterized coiled-coil protein SlyX